MEREKLLKLPIEEFEFSKRSITCLRDAGIFTIGQLVALTEREFSKIDFFGTKAPREIREILAMLDLSFKQE